MNLLTARDPALVLLSSSPYYGGEHLADSSRAYAYRYKAGNNFAKYRELWEYTDDADEWEQRLQLSILWVWNSVAMALTQPLSISATVKQEMRSLN